MTKPTIVKVTVFASAFFFVLYVGFTAIQITPEWQLRSGTEQLLLGKQLLILLTIVAFFVATPKIFGWGTLAWGVFVPLENYPLLATELLGGLFGSDGQLSLLDELRLLSLFIGTCLSALALYHSHVRIQRTPEASNENA